MNIKKECKKKIHKFRMDPNLFGTRGNERTIKKIFLLLLFGWNRKREENNNFKFCE